MTLITLKKASGSLASFLGTILGSLLVVGLIGYLTHSGLLGICGPYGSDAAITMMLLLLFTGVVAGIGIGVVVWRRIGRKGGPA